jgi:hypothetical protein
MSMRKNVQLKKAHKYFGGELPAVNVNGICAEAEAIKSKFRSPFGFCGAKLKFGKQSPER